MDSGPARFVDGVPLTSSWSAVLVGHRTARAYSEWRKRGRAGEAVSWAAYPVLWLAYTLAVCWHASSTMHAGVASMIAPNPVSRRTRRLWMGMLLPEVIVAAGVNALIHTPAPVRGAIVGIGGVCFAGFLAEMAIAWRIQHSAGRLSRTEPLLRDRVEGPVVQGSMFAAWPYPSGGQAGHLWDQVVTELHRDGVTMLALARDDGLADTYVRHGAIRPNPAEPRHVAWIARTASGPNIPTIDIR